MATKKELQIRLIQLEARLVEKKEENRKAWRSSGLNSTRSHYSGMAEQEIDIMREIIATEQEIIRLDKVPKREYPDNTVIKLNNGDSIIVVKDNCYCIMTWDEETNLWFYTHHISKEALEDLKTLPANPNDSLKNAKEVKEASEVKGGIFWCNKAHAIDMYKKGLLSFDKTSSTYYNYTHISPQKFGNYNIINEDGMLLEIAESREIIEQKFENILPRNSIHQ